MNRTLKNSSRNPFGNTLQGSNSVQKLKHFLSLSFARIEELQIHTQSKVRFRGDILEISVNRSSQLTDCSENDAIMYIKTGLLISLLINTIESYGFRTVLRTFPRFDEPDLIAFLYIENQNVSFSSSETQSAPFFLRTINTFKSPEQTILTDLNYHLKKYSLSMQPVSDLANRTGILSILKKQMPDLKQSAKDKPPQNGITPFNSTHAPCIAADDGIHLQVSLIKHLEETPLPNDLLLISSKRNMPSNWIQTGFFLGDVIHEGIHEQHLLYPLNLNCCSDTFQKECEKKECNPSSEFPQIVLFAGDYSS